MMGKGDCRVCGKPHGNYFYGAGKTEVVWRFRTLDAAFHFSYLDRDNKLYGCRDAIVKAANAADCWTPSIAHEEGEVCRA